jgi:hypothetical protein
MRGLASGDAARRRATSLTLTLSPCEPMAFTHIL